MDIYKDVAQKLLDAGHAYHCYCSQEELDTRREAARAAGKPSGYDGHCRELTAEQVAEYQAQGRTPIVRFRMPDETITFTDLVRGELTFTPENVPDYGIVRANGAPLYTLVNPVDDALMEITHILRGEDLLSSTPRQIALYKALIELGIAKGVPEFGHLPYVMGEGNKSSPSATRSRRSTSTGSAVSSPRASSTTSRSSAGRSRPTRTSSPWTRWSRPSTSRT
ncbi:glutamate--tRNA ligase family protein [Streptomyces sp. F001]|uniref:glutamate--tRNA ligase n=1 Tax=Streptomyces sp. F001 TaxID=1510026 RepID=UPI0023EA7215|nr:glutamate--tRNA ligase family protein [Streptomyces sp. F001]